MLLEDYIKIIINLTINKENKLKEEINVIQKDRLANEIRLNNFITEKNREIGLLIEENTTKTDAISGLSDQIFKLISEYGKDKDNIEKR